ncbi:MAG TPA: hypothetical protein VIK33_09110, partial [Anaerolineae bacterium]
MNNHARAADWTIRVLVMAGLVLSTAGFTFPATRAVSAAPSGASIREERPAPLQATPEPTP